MVKILTNNMSTVPFKIEDLSLVGIWGIDSKDTLYCICKRHLLAPTKKELKEKKAVSVVYKGECGHAFHPECINESLAHNKICPICKTPWINALHIDTHGINCAEVKQYVG